jgi:hypothetical protein
MKTKDRIKVIRVHIAKAREKDRMEKKTTLINQQLTAMIESILDYIEFGKGDF